MLITAPNESKSKGKTSKVGTSTCTFILDKFGSPFFLSTVAYGLHNLSSRLASSYSYKACGKTFFCQKLLTITTFSPTGFYVTDDKNIQTETFKYYI